MNGQRHGNWMLSSKGRQLWPLDLHPEDIDIEEIAHALSNICRFGGHCREFYCPTPEQRVLTADLRWIPAGDLVVGEELLAFDEQAHEPGSCNTNRRRFRPAVVTGTGHVKRRVIRLEMEDGSTASASEEHPWLVATKVSRNQTWQTSAEIANAIKDDRARYMHRFFSPWQSEATWQAGWLAGMLDGEGYLSVINRGGLQCGIAQNPGPILDRLIGALSQRSVTFRPCATGSNRTISLQIGGGFREILSLLGALRPDRLVAKYRDALFAGEASKQLDGKGSPLRIVAAYDEGEQWVAALETSTHTYFCEGFGAHNSVAQHSVLVAQALPPELTLVGLLHDATEAYIGDMVRPLKVSLPEFSSIENAAWEAVAVAFDLPVAIPLDVKIADARVLLGEKRDLCNNDGGHAWESPQCRFPDLEPYPLYTIRPLLSRDAERLFLAAWARVA